MDKSQWKEKIQEWRTKWATSKKKPYIIVGVVGVIGIWGIGTILTMSNPVYRTLKGIGKLAAKNKYDVTIGIETKTDDSLINDLTKELDNTLKLSVDKHKKQIQGAYQVAYDRDEIIDFAMVIKDGYVYMDIPQVLDKEDYVYYEMKDEYLSNKETWDLLFKYGDQLNLKGLNVKPYAKAIASATKGNVESKWNEVVFDLEGEDLVDILEEVLETAEKDEKLAKYVKKNATKILNQMVEDRFEWGDMDKKEWKEMLAEVKNKDFEEDFEESVEQLVDEFKYNASYMADDLSDLELELTVTFDLFNNIKEIVVEPKQYRQSVELTLEMGKGYKPDRKYTAKKGNNVEKLDWEDYEEIIEDTVDYIETYMKKHDEVEEIIEDLQEESYFATQEEFLQSMVSDLVYNWMYGF